MFVWLSPILDRYELLWFLFWVTRDSLLADILGNSYTYTMNVKKQSKKLQLDRWNQDPYEVRSY